MIDVLKFIAKENEVDHVLIQAIAITESNMNQYAVRYEPNWSAWDGIADVYHRLRKYSCSMDTLKMMYSTSYGLCQIMGAVYYENGGNDFATELISPSINIQYCCKIINKIKKKTTKPDEIYAIYNHGSLTYNLDRKLVNQYNVDRFMTIYSKLLN